MDKIQNIKCNLVDAYMHLLIKLQRGHPIEKYCHLREAMMQLDFLDDYGPFPVWQMDMMLDKIKYKLLTDTQ